MTKEHNLSKYFTYLTIITGMLLLIPFIAFQFSTEVNWTMGDYIFAGVLIFSTGSIFKLITTKSESYIFRIAVGIALASGFLLIWINGAVGLIGSESNLFNAYYYLVIMIGILGIFISRFRAKGLAYTMFIMTMAQTALMMIALFLGIDKIPESSVLEILGVNGLFILLFVISGLLFQYADKNSNSENPKES